MNHYAAYHTPLNSSRPNDFIPERFIDVSAFPDDRREILQPFSVGPRNCIGRRYVKFPLSMFMVDRGTGRIELALHKLAYAEGKLILGRVLWRFDMRLGDDMQNWMSEQKGYVTWLRPEVKVYLKLRQG
jgi:hypothetical protein